MLEMHLREPGFTYSACGSSAKNKERIKIFKGRGDSIHIYQNELEKACFQHDMAYVAFKDLNRRTLADKVLCDKAFNIDEDPRHEGYQRSLASMVDKCFDKKTSGSSIKNENISNKELAKVLHKPIIRKFSKKKYTHLLLTKFGVQI